MTDRIGPEPRYYLDCVENIHLPKIDHNFLMTHTTIVRDAPTLRRRMARTTAPILLDKPVYIPIFMLDQIPKERRNLEYYLLYVEKIYIDHGEGYAEYRFDGPSWLSGGRIHVRVLGLGHVTLLLKDGILSVLEVSFEYKSIAALIYFEYEHWRPKSCPF